MAESYTLYELNSMLSAAVSEAFPKNYWVTAEISELRENSSGHCYLEFIQKDELGNSVARARANIWAGTYRKLLPFFEHSTGIHLTAGIKVLVCVKVTFDPLYQYSLTVWDIDPAYTIGDMELRRNMILNRLEEEGVIDDNKELDLSPIPQRIAVISSPTAAGYGDFCHQLNNNAGGYAFYPTLFKAIMQGEQSPKSVIEALNKVYENAHLFDCVVIIRGGGASSELNCFDDYDLALNITQFPLPVIVGIGHERDITVLDYVAYKSIKTPTAVAEYLISQMAVSDEYLNELRGEIVERVKDALTQARHNISTIENKIPSVITTRIERERSRLSAQQNQLTMGINSKVSKEQVSVATKVATIKALFERVIEREKNRIAMIDSRVELLSPDAILKRGYSITVKNGYPVKSVQEIETEDNINIIFADGEAVAEIKKRENYG